MIHPANGILILLLEFALFVLCLYGGVFGIMLIQTENAKNASFAFDEVTPWCQSESRKNVPRNAVKRCIYGRNLDIILDPPTKWPGFRQELTKQQLALRS